MGAELPFADYCARVQQHIEGTYGIRVVTRDVPDPLTGDLNGTEIHIDYALNSEQRLFLLAHLFGHTVQWNLSERAFEVGQSLEPPVPETLLPAVMKYEREAASYGLQLLHDVGIEDADQWLTDYTCCDIAYLFHYYRTGEKRGFETFWKANADRIEPLSIPPFVPQTRTYRQDGIVI
jgi:hypothetical protein